jgi:uncharacterized membrane protein (UPF0182 family)
MEETLDKALDRLFPGGPQRHQPTAPVEEPGAPPPSPTATPSAPQAPPAGMDALAAEARTVYERALKAQREGNWALYGEEIKRLGEVLDKMARQKR